MYYNIKTVFVGMDVHKDSITLCCYSILSEKVEHHHKTGGDYKDVLRYLNAVRRFYDDDTEFVCGYEAGFLGYSLCRKLTRHGVKCVILAPSTMPEQRGKKKLKTDRRDAEKIARCLAFNDYKPVFVLTVEDEAVRGYIRMRNNHKQTLKQRKQQICAFCYQHGYCYDGKTYWTKAHLKWLRELKLSAVDRETLDEYLISYCELFDKIERLDQRIKELAFGDRYKEAVQKLICIKGVNTNTALTMLVEIGDFKRFRTPGHLASYLGLTPGEHSSGDSHVGLGITKAGNRVLRTALMESAQCYTRRYSGAKSKALKERQKGAAPRIVDYADRAAARLHRRYYALHNYEHKKHNVAVAAVARELACFIWGILNNEIV